MSVLCYAVLCVLSGFAIILLGKIGFVAVLLLYSECHVSIVVICLLLAVPWVGRHHYSRSIDQ